MTAATRSVKITQITEDSSFTLCTIPHHHLPLPMEGDIVWYGAELEVVKVVHHYVVDGYGITRAGIVEIIVE